MVIMFSSRLRLCVNIASACRLAERIVPVTSTALREVTDLQDLPDSCVSAVMILADQRTRPGPLR